MSLLEEAQQVEVPVERQVGVHPALHEDAGAADGLQLRDLATQLLVGVRVGVVLTARAVEAAEAATDVAHVRVVDVAVDEVADRLGIGAPTPDGVGSSRQGEERQVVEPYCLLGCQPLPCSGLRQQAHRPSITAPRGWRSPLCTGYARK